jgi:hypothetical protein
LFADDAFLSIVPDDVPTAAFNELSKMSNESCVSCNTVSNDSATRDTSINFADIESEAMELSDGIAIMFSSLDILKIEQKEKN